MRLRLLCGQALLTLLLLCISYSESDYITLTYKLNYPTILPPILLLWDAEHGQITTFLDGQCNSVSAEQTQGLQTPYIIPSNYPKVGFLVTIGGYFTTAHPLERNNATTVDLYGLFFLKCGYVNIEWITNSSLCGGPSVVQECEALTLSDDLQETCVSQCYDKTWFMGPKNEGSGVTFSNGSFITLERNDIVIGTNVTLHPDSRLEYNLTTNSENGKLIVNGCINLAGKAVVIVPKGLLLEGETRTFDLINYTSICNTNQSATGKRNSPDISSIEIIIEQDEGDCKVTSNTRSEGNIAVVLTGGKCTEEDDEDHSLMIGLIVGLVGGVCLIIIVVLIVVVILFTTKRKNSVPDTTTTLTD